MSFAVWGQKEHGELHYERCICILNIRVTNTFFVLSGAQKNRPRVWPSVTKAQASHKAETEVKAVL